MAMMQKILFITITTLMGLNLAIAAGSTQEVPPQKPNSPADLVRGIKSRSVEQDFSSFSSNPNRSVTNQDNSAKSDPGLDTSPLYNQIRPTDIFIKPEYEVLNGLTFHKWE